MTREIFGTNLQDRRAARALAIRGTQVLDRPMTMSEAIASKGMDYSIVAKPGYADLNGSYVPLHSAQVITRVDHDGTEQPIGWTGRRFRPVQNTALAAALDPITEKYPVYSVADHNGRAYFCLDAGRDSVGGEELQNYLWIIDPKSGGALRGIWTPVRMACYNMQITAVRQATFHLSIVHVGNVGAKLPVFLDAMQKVDDARRETTAAFQAMVETILTKQQRKALIASVYPDKYAELPTPTTDEAIATMEKYKANLVALRAAAEDRMSAYDDENAKLAHSAWGAYNGFTEIADWRRGRGDTALSSLVGYRAAEKANAFEAVMAVVR